MGNYEEKNKVVYILGAGASCKNGALPLVADYSDRLKACGESLEGIEGLKEYKEVLHWLAKKGKEHNTVDSFAKWCSHNDANLLYRVKQALTCFFSMEECVLGQRDTRYMQFITDMIEVDFKFPKNVKIINWNYDSQVQLASDSNRRCERFGRGDKGKTIHIPCIVDYFPTQFENGKDDNYEYDMVQMNGIARMVETFDKQLRLRPTSLNKMQPFIDSMYNSLNQWPVFNFAFEREDANIPVIDKRIQLAKKMVADVDIVVIIGYSFPSVNDFVDDELFNIMKRGDGIKKIYLQCPSLSIDGLQRRFDLPSTTLIEPITQLDSFHVALEYRRKKVTNEEVISKLIKRQRSN